MKARRRMAGSARWLIVAFVLGACSGDDNAGVTGSGNSTLLFALNAVQNDGRTVRWPTLPIPVFLGDVGAEDELTEWTRASEGRVTFAFVGSPPGAGITFQRARLSLDICGTTNIVFDNNRFIFASVRVNGQIFRGPGCVRTVTHEGGHAIGLLNHTADGGLMDTDGGNGEITGDVAAVVRDLYSLEPGTPVALAESRRGSGGRSGARHTMTFVYWAKP